MVPVVFSDSLPEVKVSQTDDILSTPPSQSPKPSIPEEVIVDMRHGNTILSNAFLGYGNEKKVFLPLIQMARILDFNISANGGTGMIKGWFLDENRTLSFDPATASGTIEGRPVTLAQDEYLVKGDDLFVDADILSKWFPVDFSYDFSEQSVLINPRETLPFQERMERAAAVKRVTRGRTDQASLPLKKSEYQFLDPMFIDFGFSGNYKETDGINQGGEGQYYFLGRGDLGFMNSELYVTGDENNRFNTTRLTLMREDPRGELLGPLNASKVSVGDIRIPGFPIIGGGKFERGAYIGNLPLNMTNEYDTTFFAGNLAPGWDVELRRNGVLLDSQRVGAEGRYSFEEVPLYYGTNEFQIKFYGPQGQEREETERIVVGSEMTRKGQSEYQVSFTQKDEKLFDPLETPNTADKETRRFIGRYRYGAGRNVSVQGGIQSQKINDETHNYLNFGVQGHVKDTFLSADFIHDLSGGNAFEALGQKKIGPLDIKLKQQYFDGFTREGETDQSNKIEAQTELSAFGVLKGNGSRPDFPFSLSLKNTRRTHSDERTAGARISAGVKNTYLNNALQWKEDTGLEGYPKFEGNTDLTSYLGAFRLRSSLTYDLYPETEIRQTQLSGLYSLSPELSSELTLAHDIENDDLVTGSLGMNWNNGKYVLSPKLSYNSDDDFTAYLSFSTSFGMDKSSKKVKFTSAREADQGALSARVYQDKNNNQIFDEGDSPISGAEVKADQSHKTAVTDEDGIAFMTGLRKHQQTDISLKQESLEDPFWEPSKQGNSILPRPGHVETLDIPVITTGEIDGTLYLEDGEGVKESLRYAPVQLLDASGQVVQELKTEYDGFYLFMKVPPGDYSVRLKPEFEKNMDISAPVPTAVTIGGEGTVVSGTDLVLKSLPLQPEPEVVAKIIRPEETMPDQAIGIAPRLMYDASPRAVAPGDTAPIPVAKGSPGTDKTEPVIRTSAIRAPETIAAGQTVQPGRPAYGLHLSSYREMEKAVRGIEYQRSRHETLTGEMAFTVKKTDLGPDKGIWYRVFAGIGPNKPAMAGLGENLRSPAPYTRLITLGSKDGEARTGIHMASYKSETRAEKGIQYLKQTYALLKDQAFEVKRVDLGPEKGIWHRVIATDFTDPDQARQLIEKLTPPRPYSAPVSIETGNQLTVHTASYRTFEKALGHLNDLVGRLGPTCPDQVSIRPVDLGKRGVWYRVALGQFDSPNDAAPLAAALKDRGDYAKVMGLSMK